MPAATPNRDAINRIATDMLRQFVETRLVGGARYLAIQHKLSDLIDKSEKAKKAISKLRACTQSAKIPNSLRVNVKIHLPDFIWANRRPAYEHEMRQLEQKLLGMLAEDKIREQNHYEAEITRTIDADVAALIKDGATMLNGEASAGGVLASSAPVINEQSEAAVCEEVRATLKEFALKKRCAIISHSAAEKSIESEKKAMEKQAKENMARNVAPSMKRIVEKGNEKISGELEEMRKKNAELEAALQSQQKHIQQLGAAAASAQPAHRAAQQRRQGKKRHERDSSSSATAVDPPGRRPKASSAAGERTSPGGFSSASARPASAAHHSPEGQGNEQRGRTMTMKRPHASTGSAPVSSNRSPSPHPRSRQQATPNLRRAETLEEPRAGQRSLHGRGGRGKRPRRTGQDRGVKRPAEKR